MARKEVTKAKPRNERITADVYSTLVGLKPQDTFITCWIPHFSFLKLLKKYNALLARYAKLRKQQQASSVYVVVELDEEYKRLLCSFTDAKKAIAYANNFKIELFKKEFIMCPEIYEIELFGVDYNGTPEDFLIQFSKLSTEVQVDKISEFFSSYRVEKLELK